MSAVKFMLSPPSRVTLAAALSLAIKECERRATEYYETAEKLSRGEKVPTFPGKGRAAVEAAEGLGYANRILAREVAQVASALGYAERVLLEVSGPDVASDELRAKLNTCP